MPISEVINYTFDYAGIKKKNILNLQQLSDSISVTYHSITNYQGIDKLHLPTDTLPFVIETGDMVFTKAQVCKQAIAWIFKKGLEDIIIILNESLAEACKFISMLELSARPDELKFEYRQQIFEKFNKTTSAAGNLNFPAMINKIQAHLSTPLLLVKEILSINTVRKCLVHRNGIVSKKDINSKNSDHLLLEYIDLVLYHQKNGKITPMTWDEKCTNSIHPPVTLFRETKSISFPLGATIYFDHNIFNALIVTATLFIDNLFDVIIAELKKQPGRSSPG